MSKWNLASLQLSRLDSILTLGSIFSLCRSHSLTVIYYSYIVFFAERGSKNHDSELYPAGRARLEPVGIILAAALMGTAALQLVIESAQQLAAGFASADGVPVVFFDAFTLAVLCLTIVAKLVLWIYCAAFAKYSP